VQFVRIAALVVLVAYTTLFVLYNGDQVKMSLPFLVTGEMPGWLVAVIAGALGAFATALVLSWPLVRLSGQHRRDARRIAQLEQELHGLRTLPLAAASHEKPDVPSPSD
jgi:hypothetical protein